MVRRLTVFLLFVFVFIRVIEAQSIIGTLVDDDTQQPIEGATILLQAADSAYIGTSVSGTDGVFILNNYVKEYCLVIQHFSYQTKRVLNKGMIVDTIRLIPKDYVLDEIVIKSGRPFVRVKDGHLEYNLSVFPGSRMATNAYEALVKLPGIQENKGVLALAGAEKLTIILNGKPSTMNVGQIETFLRNTPVNRVEKVEVMYSAPPEYHVKGAVLNVVMKRSDNYFFQGEICGDYKNQYFNSGGMNGNFRLSISKAILDVMYSAENNKSMEYMDLYSKHTLLGQIYNIEQNEQLRSKYWNHNLRTAFEYDFNEESHVSISYTGNYVPFRHNNSLTTGNYQIGNVDKYINTRMHNVTVRYKSEFGLDIGGDYTYYHSDNNQNLRANFQNGEQDYFDMKSGQRVDRYSIYADQKHRLTRNWELGYGASFQFVRDKDFQIYNQVVGDIYTQNTSSDLKETTTNFYVSMNKKSKTGASFFVSATGEYYTISNYHKWAIYPQASFSYSRSLSHMFQLSLSTNKTYPSYWNMQSSVNHLNGYTELHGTPGLKPMTAYSLNGNYVLKQKYIFGMFFVHSSDYFTQTAYQSTKRLVLIYKNTNWNYMRLWGMNVILPFKSGNWLDSHFTLTTMQMRQRCDNFFDIPFDRKKWIFNAVLDNTFKVSRELSFELIGNVQTPVIQGTFDIGMCYDLAIGMKWSFAKDKITLSVRCNDIFNTGVPKMKVRFAGQYLNMNGDYYSRSVTIHLAYRFRGYKKRGIKSVDTSRFGF
ncbi:outer membrane beta-barrel family protein [Coprobacter fastidiosus]|uniref:outer membrane beta-barrel family protein n=1 Tax=Coprobacter fastidiosus TaxID=1099853 RepID=UPI000240E328|nr:outer membrane beta-barrel family protein [Coprobacter fastidiosus]EHL88985.1 hypothetical protein HMPREF1033_00343 [Tannerella sp. 6_1_58FAA_CT1]HJF43344.1 TonB-dependent receptor family protein [Coprobacter fastidiosus]